MVSKFGALQLSGVFKARNWRRMSTAGWRDVVLRKKKYTELSVLAACAAVAFLGSGFFRRVAVQNPIMTSFMQEGEF